MTHYIPSNKKEEDLILEILNYSTFDELIKSIIPADLWPKDQDLGLGPSMSEMELKDIVLSITSSLPRHKNIKQFLGSGVYDHYVPKAIDYISSRSEFNTAYTPYQPEVSQGTLQYIYEFQSMICELSGMDISNASLYDGASALAEACSLAINYTGKKKILISSMVNPTYIEVTNTYLKYRGVEIEIIPENSAITDKNFLKEIDFSNISCLVIQSPNFYGYLEDWAQYSNILKKNSALLIAVSDPISLSVLKSPGDSGADIYVGEGQSLGNYLSYGGPNIGLFAIKDFLKRKMPGRVVGRTIDKNNHEGFVLTLQTREQHIRRSKATSNICTNQGLIALRSVIFLSLLGKKGLPELSKICYQKAQYAATKIDQLREFELYYNKKEFLKEFVIKTTHSAKELVGAANEEGIFFEIISKDKADSLIKFSFTEQRTKSEIDQLVEFLNRYEK